MRVLVLLVLTTFTNIGNAQVKDSTSRKGRYAEKYLSVLTGLSVGKYVFGEIGIAKNLFTQTGPHPFETGYSFSTDISLTPRHIVGPKVSAWASGGLASMIIGFNLIYYTDFSSGSLVFRPELGVGNRGLRITFGATAPLTNKNFLGINNYFLNISNCFRLKKLSDKKDRFKP